MRKTRKWSTTALHHVVLLASLLLSMTTIGAATPDPIEFGVTVERGDLRTVKQWLDEGLNPEYQADKIGTGLMIAAWNGNIDMMSLFLAHGANPRRANRNGEQALQLAAWGGHQEAVQWLLEHGSPLNRADLNWSALHYAVFNGHEKLARYLIERGAAINARAPNGSTPLMLAAREGHDPLAKLLLDAGADTQAKNDWGDTALTLAMRYDHYRLGQMLGSSAEFASAAKAPKESFGTASRSTSAPSEIEGLLRQLRVAEAMGKPADEIDKLRKQFSVAVTNFKRSATPVAPSAQNSRRPAPLPYQPKSIVITAKRGQPGAERAEILTNGSTTASSARTQATAVSPAQQSVSLTQVAELLRQLRLAEAQGKTESERQALRRQLYEAVDTLRK